MNVDMRQNHKGLLEFLKKKKIKIKQGDYIVFMNGKRTMLKMLCNSEFAILHYKKDNRPIDPGVILYLPKFCNGTEFNVDAAREAHLRDMLARKKK